MEQSAYGGKPALASLLRPMSHPPTDWVVMLMWLHRLMDTTMAMIRPRGARTLPRPSRPFNSAIAGRNPSRLTEPRDLDRDRAGTGIHLYANAERCSARGPHPQPRRRPMQLLAHPVTLRSARGERLAGLAVVLAIFAQRARCACSNLIECSNAPIALTLRRLPPLGTRSPREASQPRWTST